MILRKRSDFSRVAPMLLAAALLGLITVLAGRLLAPGDGDALRADLLVEFDGAYSSAPDGGGELVEIELVAAPAVIALVEAEETEVWAYNGSVPGPSLRIDLGDRLRVSVRNELPEATTIHWHGVRVPNNMDGVPEINQPPIEPGATFVYEFTPPDSGTYWYHSHTNGSEQLERGLYGSLIVDDPDDQASYALDAVWVLDDWLLTSDAQINDDFNTAADRSQNGRWGNLITVNANTDENLAVMPGERVRLRLINASNGRVYMPEFGALDARAIAIDGQVARVAADSSDLQIAPGNRADLDITAPSTPGTYRITDVYGGATQALGSIVVTGDRSLPVPGFVAPENPRVPSWSDASSLPVDHELVFETNKDSGEWVWTINGASFPDYQPLELTSGEFTKIRLKSATHPIHPIHLHGVFFKVLSRNGVAVDEPFFRDTVLLESLDEVEIGLVPLDVGTWVLHCHTQEHAEAGMMTLLEVSAQ